MKNFIELKNITKKYGNKTVLNDINFSIPSNQVVALLGGNGTGKSTLLRLIAGIEKPSSGNIQYASNEIVIGYVPERFPKNLRFTPSEYLSYMGSMGGIPKVTLEAKMRRLLLLFQLEQFKDIRIHELSKGNIQKVGIIQALLQHPDILILDEPLSGLDKESQEMLMETIKELKDHGSTIILTYHEANLLEPVVDKTYFLVDGKLTSTKVNDSARKLLIINSMNKSYVKDWEGILQIEDRENQLYLYVSQQHSDEILFKVLELKGSVEAVSPIDSMEEGREA
ncbi:ABC transporter ATP-binding protein [Ornithinibacillus scapharcae]|uniref:ABC transporter ATP-binding protein n=1 Tax=Ornithinibacillus scapharcae TaxID=1147159 RepID=UPI000225AA77|nr:ATP-binding cassette domain-containing protein [Ornithinibacillus scapharcae]